MSANIFVQEDRITTPRLSEVKLIPPKLLDTENGFTVFLATTSGRAGELFDTFIEALTSGRLDKGAYLDISDSAGVNFKHVRCIMAELDKYPNLRALLIDVRCDGHMLHCTASISLLRSRSMSVLHSAAIFLRMGTYKYALIKALHDQVKEELIWETCGVVVVGGQLCTLSGGEA